MRQLTFVKPKVLEWREVGEPRIDSSRQAIVAPVAGTTCDLDRSIIKGRALFGGAFAIGHEFCAKVTEVGEAVRGVAPGDLVVVPAQISCGECDRCRSGSTAFCASVPPNSMYGLGASAGSWGGGFSDLVRVPFADYMLVRLPVGVLPQVAAAASDNLTNAFEIVVPHVRRIPGAKVLVAGVGATGLYAIQMALASGAGRVDYLDHDPARLNLAQKLGANPIVINKNQAKPSLPAEYELAVDARGEPEDLQFLVNRLAPRGICMCVSMYYREIPLPLLQMFLRGLRFEATPTNVRAHLGEVLAMIQSGKLYPELVATEILDWEDLPRALSEPSMKPVFVRNCG